MQDWEFLEAAAGDLEAYLLSPVLYYPMAAVHKSRSRQEMLQLTLGNVLLTIARLQAVDWAEEEDRQLEQLVERVLQVHTRWKSNWQLKVEQEIPARLTLWQNSLTEWAENKDSHLSGYRHQVRWRVILHLLMDEPGGHFVEKTLLTGLDSRLRYISTPGAFVWEKEIQSGFSQSEYWYLYLSLSS